MLRIAANDAIIRHDALWPRGLNELLYVQTPLEVAELRLSCLRHRWPPADADVNPREKQINLPRLRARLQQQVVAQSAGGATVTTKAGAGARPPSKSSTQPPTSPTTSTKPQPQTTKSNLPSPINRRPATATKSPSSPTKTPRSRPQSAPKPSSRPSARTPQSAAKSTPSASNASDRSPTEGPAAPAVAESTSTSTTSSANFVSSPPHHENVIQHTTVTSTADVDISTVPNAPGDLAATVGCPQIPAIV